MAGIKLEQGKRIYECGQPMSALHLITQGSVRVCYPGGDYTLEKGDVIGICEIGSEVHYLSYEVKENATILSYPYTGADALSDFLGRHPDIAVLFVCSAFRQISTLLQRSEISGVACANLYREMKSDYALYQTLCKRYRIFPRVLKEADDIRAYLGDMTPDLWLTGYYMGLLRVFSMREARAFVRESPVLMGLLNKCSLDSIRAYSALEEQNKYRIQIHSCYFNEKGDDLFDFFTSLYYRMGADSPDSDSLYADINRMILQADSDSLPLSDLINQRVDSFHQSLILLHPLPESVSQEYNSDMMSQLAGSLDTILAFAGADIDLCSSFRQHIYAYKQLEDIFSPDDEAEELRRQLTEEFHSLYSIVFTRCLEETQLPLPVKMFLYFGYVDEELAGTDCASYLSRKALSMKDHTASGIYTLYDWLMAIFHGKKEPSRNEFDVDYTTYINNQRLGGAISEADYQHLLTHTISKVAYELRGMFPPVNKMTFGRVASYCPIFTKRGLLKELPASRVTASAVGEALARIMDVDYSLFYRETLDKDNWELLGKETIHVECLPDIILMPGAGIRGIMWQEIEGKKRTTPARMALPIFYMEDLDTAMLRLAAEYRWEMCKRIQGSRWNDVSDRSLTSEYFDYMQFYRKNHDLSSEAKDRIRLSLQRSKNSFKEVFIKDYMIWILFEGKGSPRLNKVARQILFTYCPFPQDVCEDLAKNPLYTELIRKNSRSRQQRLHHLHLLTKRLNQSGDGIPKSLEEEIHYTLR